MSLDHDIVFAMALKSLDILPEDVQGFDGLEAFLPLPVC